MKRKDRALSIYIDKNALKSWLRSTFRQMADRPADRSGHPPSPPAQKPVTAVSVAVRQKT